MKKTLSQKFLMICIVCSSALYAQNNPSADMYDIADILHDQKGEQTYVEFLNRFKPSRTIENSECRLTAKRFENDRYYSIEFSNCINIDDGEKMSMVGWKTTDHLSSDNSQFPNELTRTYQNTFSEPLDRDECDREVCTKYSSVQLKFFYTDYQNMHPTAMYGHIDVSVEKYNIDDDLPYIGSVPRSSVVKKSYSLEIR